MAAVVLGGAAKMLEENERGAAPGDYKRGADSRLGAMPYRSGSKLDVSRTVIEVREGGVTTIDFAQ